MKIQHLIALIACTIGFGFLQITDALGVAAGATPWIFSVQSFVFALLGTAIILGMRIARSSDKNALIPWLMPKEAWLYVIIIAIIASGVGTVLAVTALQFTTPTNKGIMQPMYAVFTVLFSFFALGERLPRSFFLILSGMLAGLILLTSNGFVALPNQGDWLLFITIPLVGFTNTLSKRLLQIVDPTVVVFWRYAIATTVVTMAFVILFGFPTLSDVQLGVLWAAGSGLCSVLYANSMYYAMRSVGPSITAAFISAGPVITALLSFLIFGETLSVIQLIGFILVVTCAVALSRVQATYIK